MDNTFLEPVEDTNLTNITTDTSALCINNLYIKAATSHNTRIAYQSDIRHFEQWGGKLPAKSETIIQYLQTFAPLLNARTLARRVTALKNWHTYQGFSDPTYHPAVQKTLIGITRIHGKPKQKAYPLALNDLIMIVNHLLAENTFASLRDNALLQVGYFGAFRRSELVAICCEHITWKPEGIDILIPHSKTDPEHEGQYCGIPLGKNILCPVTALKNWLEAANITKNAIFREIKKGEKLKENALSPISINLILKKRAKEAGIHYADKLSGHSLRRGLATTASLVGANLAAIMRQGRWKQVNTIMEYVDAANRFADNVTTTILQTINKSNE